MKKWIIAIFLAFQSASMATPSWWIRMDRSDADQPLEKRRFVVNDRSMDGKQLSALMDRVVKFTTNQTVTVEISKDTYATHLLETFEMLRSKGLNNVEVYSLEGLAIETSATNKFSFTLIPTPRP